MASLRQRYPNYYDIQPKPKLPATLHLSPFRHIRYDLKPAVTYSYAENDRITVHTKDGPIEQFTEAEYNAFFHIKRVNGIYYCPEDQHLVEELKKQAPTSSTEQLEKIRNVKKFLAHPKNYFDVKYLNEKMGYVLIANQDIPPYTIVGIYAGQLIFHKPEEPGPGSREERAYDMSTDGEVTVNKQKYHVTVRANQYGDITRFAPDLIIGSQVASTGLSTKHQSQLITSNIHFNDVPIDGIPTPYYITNDKWIRKGEIGGVNYGDGYWRYRGKPDRLLKVPGGVQVVSFSKELNKYVVTNDIIKLESFSIKQEEKNQKPAPAVLPALLPKPTQMRGDNMQLFIARDATSQAQKSSIELARQKLQISASPYTRPALRQKPLLPATLPPIPKFLRPGIQKPVMPSPRKHQLKPNISYVRQSIYGTSYRSSLSNAQVNSSVGLSSYSRNRGR